MVILEATRTKGKTTAGDPSRSAIQTRQIRDLLRGTGYSALRGVTCEVRDGVAFLYGRLRTYHLKQVAQSVAIEMEGIVSVENRIEVVSDGRGLVGSNLSTPIDLWNWKPSARSQQGGLIPC